jgi:hypothetical protein
VLVDALGDHDRLKAMGVRAAAVAKEMSLDRHLDRLESIFSVDVPAHAYSAGR